ncbi:MAG: hypothetical protein EXS05_20770 [Planctomycetaceae bacterium]|nr:hypothetical protein [Planctomycetaceae bacterium]
MSATELLLDLARLGIRLEASGNRLRYHPRSALTPDLANRLIAHKAEILASLRPGIADNRQITFDPTHPLATFDWDSSNGYCPGRPVVLGGIHHKREACASRRSWRHVWGERYCSACWPCADAVAMVNDERENPKAGE